MLYSCTPSIKLLKKKKPIKNNEAQGRGGEKTLWTAVRFCSFGSKFKAALEQFDIWFDIHTLQSK